MYTLWLITILSVCLGSVVNGQTSCTTPDSGPGQCIPFHDCPPLLDIVAKKKRTSQEELLLWNSACKSVRNVVSLCCPVRSVPNPLNDCVTPNGNRGRCMNVNSCDPLMSLLRSPPISDQTKAFVRGSSCPGSDPYNVCCDSTPAEERLTYIHKCAAAVTATPPDSASECCGKDAYSGDRIVGGNVTAIDQYPWLALIEYFIDNHVMKTLCGGSLISGRYVLTAGHCIVGDVLKHGIPRHVRLGEFDSTNEGPDCAPAAAGGVDCTTGAIRIGIAKMIPHPEYQPYSTARHHDIALIRLSSMAPFSDFVRPICLPSVDSLASPPPNLTLFVAGWGSVLGGTRNVLKSPQKQHVDVPHIDIAQCGRLYASNVANVSFWKGQTCAGGQAGKDSCQGDSGGPLMLDKGRFYELVGVVSYGHVYCASANVPGIYTKVFEYKDWIISNIQP